MGVDQPRQQRACAQIDHFLAWLGTQFGCKSDRHNLLSLHSNRTTSERGRRDGQDTIREVQHKSLSKSQGSDSCIINNEKIELISDAKSGPGKQDWGRGFSGCAYGGAL
jgi:hypothetical protein